MRMHVRPALSALGAVLAFSACGGEPPERAGPAPLEIGGTAFVVRDTLVVDVFEAAGVAEPVQRAMLASKLMARVTEVLVQEGDRVGAGQVLARLDARDLSARAEQAAAGLTGAEAGYQEALAQAH
ncbi:MAG TPA: biotin/lipoyl-binding protein, partial [Gemmatimonadales bacterium]